jgi:CMP-N,N'-diacetyllegionaminic acid synthase
MKYLALIPARGGSKRLPGKNLLPLGGKPLIYWTLDVAKQLGSNVDVLVSTDDKEIASAARRHGASVPWMRPAALSSDTSTSLEVALHALDLHEQLNGSIDGLILLQPTSPFRTLASALKGIELFECNRKAAVVAVADAATHPGWCFKIVEGQIIPYLPDALSLRSQDLTPAVEISGALYIIEPSALRKYKTFFPPGTIPLRMTSPVESLDIDTEIDWLYAEKIVEAGLVKYDLD